MTTQNDTTQTFSWRQAILSVAVLGGFLVAAFGEQALKHVQRYYFLGQEMLAGHPRGSRCRLLQDYLYQNEKNEPRRLFLLEGTGPFATHNCLILTDDNYRIITRLEFQKPGTCNNITLVRTVSPPLFEVVIDGYSRASCIQYNISEDRFTPYPSRPNPYQTASVSN
jgi:hypothetical protein